MLEKTGVFQVIFIPLKGFASVASPGEESEKHCLEPFRVLHDSYSAAGGPRSPYRVLQGLVQRGATLLHFCRSPDPSFRDAEMTIKIIFESQRGLGRGFEKGVNRGPTLKFYCRPKAKEKQHFGKLHFFLSSLFSQEIQWQ